MKKLLALVLALVMTLSLCVTSNAAYTDAADIDYTEAVDVMTAVGVFNGTDGKFNGKDILTREQAAKIVTYMLLGKKAADALVTIAAPFADVAADRWSAGSIAYCYNEGILAGVGNGMFAPTAELTGLAFAKMMLTALGYDATYEGLTGESWSINAAKLALKLKLTKGMNDIALSNPMTREQAAQMAFNTIKTATVSYTGGMTVEAGSNTTVKVGANRHDGEEVFYKLYLSGLTKSNVAVDTLGRPATTWSWKNIKVGTYADTPVLTYTSNMNTTAGKKTVKADVASYVKNATGAAVDHEALARATKNGKIVEVYVNDNIATWVEIQPVYTSVAKVTSSKVTLAYNDYTVDEDSKLWDTFKGLSKKDNVIVVVDGTDVLEAYVPETVTGKYTKKVDNTYTIGGAEYKLAENAVNGRILHLGDQFKLTLDKFGYIVDVDTVETAENYAFVLSADKSRSQDDYTASLKLLFADGSTKWIDVATVDGEDVDSTNYDLSGSVNKFVSYTEKDGAYDVVPEGVNNPAGTVTVAKKALALSGALGSKVTSASNFLFYNSTSKTYSSVVGYASVPTTTVNANGGYFLLDDTNTLLMAVVKDYGSATTTSQVFVYGDAAESAESTTSGTVYTINALVDGEETTIKYTRVQPVQGLYLNPKYDAKGNFSSDNTRVTTTDTKAAVFAYKADMDVTVKNGVLTVVAATTDTYAVAADCAYYFVDLSSADPDTNVFKPGKTDTFDGADVLPAGSQFIVVFNDDGAAKAVYVVKAGVLE